MKTQIKALKVKIKSLAAEARIIRLEETKAILKGHQSEARKKYRDDTLYGLLRGHRVFEYKDGRRSDLRTEQRSALLAYGYLRGREYKAVETPRKKTSHGYTLNAPDWKRVLELVNKFGGMPGKPLTVTAGELSVWFKKVPEAVQA